MTYAELRAQFANDELRHRVEVAVLIAASSLLAGLPSAEDAAWAAAVFSTPQEEGRKAFRGVLAANVGVTVEQLSNVSDLAIQNNVDALIPSLVVAFNARV